jgi:hypothetical protein
VKDELLLMWTEWVTSAMAVSPESAVELANNAMDAYMEMDTKLTTFEHLLEQGCDEECECDEEGEDQMESLRNETDRLLRRTRELNRIVDGLEGAIGDAVRQRYQEYAAALDAFDELGDQ